MPETPDINEHLKRDFPETRLTHEPIFPPTAKHREINGGGIQLKPGKTIADQLEAALKEALEHLAHIRRLAGEIGQ